MDSVHFRRWVAAAGALLLGALVVTAQAEPSNKWRIKLNHRADNDGSIGFRIRRIDGTPIDVETKVPANTSENHIAKLMRDAMKATLGEGYHVETDDGEDVLIKKRKDTPNFDLTLVSSTVTGVTIKL